jgi:hypothetical protein
MVAAGLARGKRFILPAEQAATAACRNRLAGRRRHPRRALLAALADLDTIGAYAFFIAWQATYAAALAHVLARKR